MRRELSFDTVLTAYGLTEAVVATMCRPGDDPDTVAHTSGRATAGFEVRVAGPDGSEPGPGEPGEILLRGPNVMLGYLDDPAATRAAVDADGWLHTGDIGRLDARGYLTITDRLKDMYICGGFNVYPAEVEQVLARLDGVAESAVIGVPDARLGEVGKAYVVLRPGHALAEPDVLAFCRERLANYKVPAGGGVPRRRCPATRRARRSSACCGRNPRDRRPWGDPGKERGGEPASPQFRAEVAGLAGRARARPGRCRRWTPPRGSPGTGTWERELAEARLAVVSWPERYGGRDASLLEWLVFEEEYHAAAAPVRVGQNGLFLLAPDAVHARHRRSSGTGCCRRWPGPTRSGPRRGRNRTRAATWPRSGPAPCAPREAGCCRARRPGARARPSPTGRSACSAPTRAPSGTAA